jgi:hypothetical protein
MHYTYHFSLISGVVTLAHHHTTATMMVPNRTYLVSI